MAKTKNIPEPEARFEGNGQCRVTVRPSPKTSTFTKRGQTSSADMALPYSKLDLGEHNRIVGDLSAQVRGFAQRGEKFRIFHGSSNSTRPQPTDKTLDVSRLNKVLYVAPARPGFDSWCLVEPNVPMDKLVEATMRCGFVPPVVMEFPGITVGGGFSGTSGESSSLRHGYFSDNVSEVEMILGNGDVVKATSDSHDNGDLFHGAAGALGTLGIVTVVKLALIQARPFIQVDYRRLGGLSDAIDELRRLGEDSEYIDSIMFSKEHAVAITGNRVDEGAVPKDARIKTFSDAGDDWFYRHVRAKTTELAPGESVREYVPLAEYLFRYDRGGFWVGEMGYQYFQCIPFNGFMRWMLDDYSHTRTLYHALHATGVSCELIIQDIAVPWGKAVDLIEHINDDLDIWPLWLCPLAPARQSSTFHPVAPVADQPVGSEMLSVGLWGWGPKDPEQFVAKNRGLEKTLAELGGRKWLYAHTYYTEEEFWDIYDRKWYEQLREKYHATSLASVFDKVKRSTGGDKGWAKALLQMWPVGGIYGMWLATRSGDIRLHRDAKWKWIGTKG